MITALEPNSLPTDLFVYPNPSQGRVIVESAELGLFEQIEVINSFGKTLHQSLIEKGSIRQEIVDLPSGVHFIRLSGRNGVATKKVIIN